MKILLNLQRVINIMNNTKNDSDSQNKMEDPDNEPINNSVSNIHFIRTKSTAMIYNALVGDLIAYNKECSWTPEFDEILLGLMCNTCEDSTGLAVPPTRSHINFSKLLTDWVHHGFAEIGDTKGLCKVKIYRELIKDPRYLNKPIEVAKTYNLMPSGEFLPRCIAASISNPRVLASVNNSILYSAVTHSNRKSLASGIALTTFLHNSVMINMPSFIRTENPYQINIDHIHFAVKMALNKLETEEEKKEFVVYCNADLDWLLLNKTEFAPKLIGIAFWSVRELWRRVQYFRDNNIDNNNKIDKIPVMIKDIMIFLKPKIPPRCLLLVGACLGAVTGLVCVDDIGGVCRKWFINKNIKLALDKLTDRFNQYSSTPPDRLPITSIGQQILGNIKPPTQESINKMLNTYTPVPDKLTTEECKSSYKIKKDKINKIKEIDLTDKIKDIDLTDNAIPPRINLVETSGISESVVTIVDVERIKVDSVDDQTVVRITNGSF